MQATDDPAGPVGSLIARMLDAPTSKQPDDILDPELAGLAPIVAMVAVALTAFAYLLPI